MDWRARGFIVATIASGAAVVAYGLAHMTWPDPGRFFCYLALVVLASGFKIVLPGINGTLSVNFLFILLGVIELSPGETLLLACVGALVQTHWHARNHVQAVHFAFNAAQLANSVALCYLVYYHSSGLLGERLPLRLMATAIMYFLGNTVPVAEVISLTEHRPFHQLWVECYFWSFPYYLVGAAICGLVSWINATFGWQLSVLVAPVVYLMYRSYRLYLGKLEDEKKHVEQMAALHLRTIEALALAIDAKDHTTHDHLQRVRTYALEIGKELKLDASELEALRTAALLHDIGKLAVPEHIINKPGRLSPEEFEKMKIHPIVGAEILDRVNFPCPVVPIVRAHHEKWDGTGYPDGLKGEEIPIGARILSAVDCLDAMASDRQYRPALPLEEAMQEVCSQSGKQFDPRVVEVLKRRYIELEHMANAGKAPSAGLKVSKDVKVARGAAPAAGLEKLGGKAAGEAPFLSSIAAARSEAQALLELSTDLGKSLSLDETLSLVAARVRKLVPYDAIAIYMVKEGKLHPAFVTGDDFRLVSALRIPVGEGLSGWVALNHRPIVNGNPAVEFVHLEGHHNASCLSSALALPLIAGEDLLAVLTLYKVEKDAFSADHLRILLAISDKVGASIKNALQYQAAKDSATTDYLTKLPNARSLYLHLDSEIARCERENTQLAAIVCDLDGFKQINDKFGHLTGDKVLQAFAAKLRQSCRRYDYVSRMGGDEFVLIVPGSSPESTLELTSRLSGLASESARQVCPDATLSASVGSAVFPVEAANAVELLEIADRRMYSMKQEGEVPAPVPEPALVM